MHLEVRHLQQFVAVAEELHFSRAAERLRIAQPALSAQIKRLEDSLRFPLFERSTRHVRLSSEGEQLFAAAKAVLETWNDAMVLAGSLRQGESGRVSLGISLRMHSGVRVDIQSRLAALSPGVSVEFTAESSPRLVEAVAAARLDAAVCLAPARLPGLRYQAVRDDPVVAALPAGHRLAGAAAIALSELADDVWLMPDRSLGSTSLLREMCAEAGVEVRTSEDSTTNFDDEFLAVATGAGIEVVTSSIVPRRTVDGVVFVPVKERAVPLEIVSRSDAATPALGSVTRAVVESLRLDEPAPLHV